MGKSRHFAWKTLTALGLLATLFHGSVQAENPKSDLEFEAEAQEGRDTDVPPVQNRDGLAPTGQVAIRINLPATRLDLYVDGSLQKSYPIAIGMARYPTPVREFSISQIIWNPWWIPPDSDWAKNASPTPPGPGNPLGSVKMMMEAGVRIHGTNKPSSIGHAASHACLRMNTEDARELAWEIQKRYSEKNDDSLLSEYQRNSRRSYPVNLFQEVSVSVDYQQVERQGDQIFLYPNFYGKAGFQRDLEAALADQNIEISRDFVNRLDRQRRQGPVELSISELRSWARQDNSALNPHAASALQAAN